VLLLVFVDFASKVLSIAIDAIFALWLLAIVWPYLFAKGKQQ
jgi:hypothetical protein